MRYALKSDLRKYPIFALRVAPFLPTYREGGDIAPVLSNSWDAFGGKRMGNRRGSPRPRHTHCGGVRKANMRPDGVGPVPRGLQDRRSNR